MGDTVKPRLMGAEADLDRVLVIDEAKRELTLSDERIEKAITQNEARLIILDPIQAYMGEKTDMNRANEVRPMFRRLADVAERTGCAVILIGHLNKAAGGQSAYRGLGSIDFRAAARSVLLIGRVKREPNVRVIVHDKSSLAPEGKPVAFCLDPDTGFEWIGPGPSMPPAGNFHITDDHLGEGGPKEKYRRNVEAIRTLKAIEVEGRGATEAEQEVLSRYVGWGGLPQVFDQDKEDWHTEYAELKGVLDESEYAAARSSTLNAHYTSPTVIKAVYEALGNFGFQKGNILEPSCGVGNFFGLLPEAMAGSQLYGVELDSITGRIASLLYPEARIAVRGFEKVHFPNSFFDVAVGNVPFGQYPVNDPAYNKLGFHIHNYFFAKALDQVRPGGIVAFLTSRYTLDAKDEKVRRYLAQRAELLGAVRLPNNAFKANAGTEVVSDIIFLQKRDHLIDIVPDWVRTRETAEGFTINHYFTAHPEMVLGRAASESTQYGHQDYTVLPIEGADLAQQLHEAVGRIHGQIPEVEVPELGDEEEPVSESAIPADPNVKNYSYTVVDGEVYFRENSIMVKPRLNATATARVIGMVELRDCVNRLIDLQMDDADALSIQAEQKKLNTLYDAFTARFGLISNRGNELAFSDDNSYYLLSSLEVLDEDGNLQRKADMFTKRTIRPHRAVTHVDTASEALAVSISEKARVDMPYMAQLTGKTEAELAAELRGVIFRVPNETDGVGGPQYAAADEYLSGNVRQKLAEAKRAADADPMYQDNVEALRQALPKDLDASEIDLRLGATWIDQKYIQQFMYETLQTPRYLQGRIRVLYSQFTVEWSVTSKTAIPYSPKFRSEHEADILLHQAAKQAFDQLNVKKLPKMKALQAEYAALLAEKKEAYAELRKARDEAQELLIVKANVDRILQNTERGGNAQEKGTVSFAANCALY